MMACPQYLTLAEAALRLHVTPRLLQDAVKDGLIRYIKYPDGEIRFSEQALDDFARGFEVKEVVHR